MRYYIETNISPKPNETLMEALKYVSEQRREKVLRFKFDANRWQSLRAYQLLQRALEENYGIEEPPVFRIGDNGKPFIIGHEEIHFNLSHCKSAVACAVSDCPVGIDVEYISDTLKDSLAEYVFNKKELEMINNVRVEENIDTETSRHTMFARLWTMKEAVVKLSGIGITGSKQLRPLLDDWHNANSNINIITQHSITDKWALSVATEKTIV